MDKCFLIILLENNDKIPVMCCCSIHGKSLRPDTIQASATIALDIDPFLKDETGVQLFDALYLLIAEQQENCKKKKKCDCVSISLPGIIQNNEEIIMSSRLGIRKPICAADILQKKLRCDNLPIFLFHDTEALLAGEIMATSVLSKEGRSLVYIFVDEGIGCKIMIDGNIYTGNGSAGALSRLIMQPDGVYYPDLRAFGSLEVQVCRPWISRRLVEVFDSEKGKDMPVYGTEKRKSQFRKTLEAVAEDKVENWSKISYESITMGINDKDPIATRVISTAARHLGLAMSTIIALINPETIILGGSMVTRVPLFVNFGIHCARQFTWPMAWNNTKIIVSNQDRHTIQVNGSASLSMNRITTK